MSSRGAGLAVQLHILHTLRKCRRHAPCYVFHATRLGASFPPGRKDQGDPVARAMRAAMLEAVGGLGCAVGEGQCIGTLIGNRLELSLFLSSPVRDIGSCGGAI
jgi:hypothetical protein